MGFEPMDPYGSGYPIGRRAIDLESTVVGRLTTSAYPWSVRAPVENIAVLAVLLCSCPSLYEVNRQSHSPVTKN
jgi:hypothetical protein